MPAEFAATGKCLFIREAGRASGIARRTVPLWRIGWLREVEFLASYLTAPASDSMTARTMRLDGGLSIG